MTIHPDKNLEELAQDRCNMPAPIPLDTATETISPYPLELLPELAQKAVRAYQSYGQQPLPILASSTLASMSLACQGLANVARDKELVSPISLYFIVIAESGERKTASDKSSSKPIMDWEQIKIDGLEPEIKKSKADFAAYAAKKDALITKIKRTAGKGGDTLTLENDLRELELNEPKKVAVPKLFHEETTAEALAYSLASGWQSSSLWSDEAGIIVGGQGMNQDNILKAITLLNRLWDGNVYRVDRKTSDNFKIEGRRLTCSLMMQPAVFDQFISRCGNISRGSGFLARCLVIMPPSTMGTRFYKEPSDIADIKPFHERITQLLNIPLPLDQQDRLTPKVLHLTPDAKKIWIVFHDEIEKQLKTGGEYEAIRDFASKAAENAVRLAGIFHMFKGVETNSVDCDTLQCAIGVMAWHLGEISRIIKKQLIPQEYQDAQLFADWLIENKINTYKVADLLRFAPNCLRNKGRRDKALCILADHYYIELTGNQFIVNPKLWSNKNV